MEYTITQCLLPNDAFCVKIVRNFDKRKGLKGDDTRVRFDCDSSSTNVMASFFDSILYQCWTDSEISNYIRIHWKIILNIKRTIAIFNFKLEWKVNKRCRSLYRKWVVKFLHSIKSTVSYYHIHRFHIIRFIVLHF